MASLRAIPPPPPQRRIPPTASQDTLQSTKSQEGILAALLKRPPPPPRTPTSVSAVSTEAPQSIRKLPPAILKSEAALQLRSSPPPIPWHTRPITTPHPDPLHTDISLEISNIKESEVSVSDDGDTCLLCHNFSVEDAHGSLFPRHTIAPTLAGLKGLAHDLTFPFASATSKARAIFSWMHHNIIYDTVSFLSGNLKPPTPTSTLQSGLAVCEGYAGLYTQLATYAGLDCITLHGHGKGYGITINPHIIPDYASNHAWNMVTIDHGEHKLIDSCWGAGALMGSPPVFQAGYNPSWFVMSNRQFGYKHFPSDGRHWFLTDENVQGPQTWAEYITSDSLGRTASSPTFFGRVEVDHGIAESSFCPPTSAIDTSSSPTTSIRFQFEKVCIHSRPHYPVPYVFVLAINNASDYIPFQTNGFHWWVDVELSELGLAGGEVFLYTVTSMNGVDARGKTTEDYLAMKGRAAMTFGGVASWHLV